MKKFHVILLCFLTMPAIAIAQESGAQTAAESAAQQIESKVTQSSDDGENQQAIQDNMSSQQDQQTSSSQYFMQQQEREQVRSSQLVGSPIVNSSDEEIGTIDNLLLDKDGQVVGIIVSVGGFLGIGEKHVALSWDAVEITGGEEGGDYMVTTQVDRAALEGAQAFKTQEQQQAEQQAQQIQQQQQQQMQQEQQQPLQPEQTEN